MKVKVQKRDGRIVEYNADKITAAIKKANVGGGQFAKSQ